MFLAFSVLIYVKFSREKTRYNHVHKEKNRWIFLTMGIDEIFLFAYLLTPIVKCNNLSV